MVRATVVAAPALDAEQSDDDDNDISPDPFDQNPASVPPLVETVRLATRPIPPWANFLGWVGVATLVYLLIAAVAIISRGFAGITGEGAVELFEFAANPFVGLFVGVLATVLVQSSSTTTAITVTAVGAGVLPLSSAVPILFGANVGTTVTATMIALGYIGNREEYGRALAASTIHDFYNWISLAVFFPIELAFQPLQRASAWLTDLTYGTAWLPNPNDFNFVRNLTNPVVNLKTGWANNMGLVGAVLVTIIGVTLILFVVRFLSKLLKRLLVGRAKRALVRAADRHPVSAVATGVGITMITQSSTVTTSVLQPFAAMGVITPKQLYPITVGANVGTTFTTVLAAFAIVGANATIGLQAALVHLLYNIGSMLLIYTLPVLRPFPLLMAQWFSRVASTRKWVIAVYLIGAFLLLPTVMIVLIGVL